MTTDRHAQRWADFDREHPEVYAEIKRLALLDLTDPNVDRSSIGYLVEQARRNLRAAARDPSVRDAQGYMINNSARAIIVRRLIAENPELADMFVLRERRAA